MILVDTSVWIDHFRATNSALAALAAKGDLLSHYYVEGELALGYAPAEILALFRDSAKATIAGHAEVMRLIVRASLAGSGIGYVDAHLLASTLLTSGALLWTRDRRLQAATVRLDIAMTSPE